MTNESISLTGIEETLRQVTGAAWSVDSLNIDFSLFYDDLEEVRRDPKSYGLEPENFSLGSFEGQDIGDYLDPAGTVHAYHPFMEEGRTTGDFVSMRVELRPGGAVKRCLVNGPGRRAWLDVGREVPTPATALRMYRIKYPKKRAA